MPGGTNILVSSGVVNNPFMSVKGLWETCCGIFNAGDAPLGNALFVGLLAFFTVVASSQISPQRPLGLKYIPANKFNRTCLPCKGTYFFVK